MITKDELKKLDNAGLVAEIASLKKELFNLNLGKITGQVKDTSQFKKIRSVIATAMMLKDQGAQASRQTKRSK